MALHDYVCKKCGAIFETLLRLNEDDSTVRCPKCGAEKVERRVSRCSPTPSPNCGRGSGFT